MFVDAMFELKHNCDCNASKVNPICPVCRMDISPGQAHQLHLTYQGTHQGPPGPGGGSAGGGAGAGGTGSGGGSAGGAGNG